MSASIKQDLALPRVSGWEFSELVLLLFVCFVVCCDRRSMTASSRQKTEATMPSCTLGSGG